MTYEESTKQFDAAVDWLLNNVADLDEQHQFWALAHGLVTEGELRELGMDEIRRRLSVSGVIA
jgi:hypothetical protein